MAVINRGEVELYGVRYPILGPVQRTPVNPFPGKITIGDYTRDDEVVASTWVQSSWSGGVGIENGVYPRDQERSWYSTLETRWSRTLALPPKISSTSLSAVTDGTARSIRFGGLSVFSLGDTLYQAGSDGTVSSVHTFDGTITDLAVNGDLLWIAGEDFQITSWDGDTTFTEEGDQEVDREYRLLTAMGGWLYAMRADGTLDAYTPGSGWDSVGKLELPAFSARQLLSFPIPGGSDYTVYAVCTDGLYVLEASTNRFFQTEVTWTPGVHVGRACIWRSELYIPVGSSIYRWNGSVLAMVGPDKDEGLPVEFPDQIQAVYPSPGYLVAALVGRTFVKEHVGLGVATATDSIRLGSRFQGRFTFGISSRATVESGAPELVRGSLFLVSSGGGWSHLANEILDSTLPVGVLEFGGRVRVLWFTSSQLKWTELPATLYNPLKPAIIETVKHGSLISPWFDAQWTEIDKVLLNVKIRVEAAASDAYINVFIQRDNETKWIHLGTIMQPGETVFVARELIPTRTIFRRIRLRLDLVRESSTETKTPTITSWALAFLRRPPVRNAFSFTVDISASRQLSPTELRNALIAAAESQEVGEFSYADDPAEKHQVVISRLAFLQSGGMEGQEGTSEAVGRAAVSVIEV